MVYTEATDTSFPQETMLYSRKFNLEYKNDIKNIFFLGSVHFYLEYVCSQGACEQ